MRQHLLVLLACVFVAMTGVGITIPVLPFYVERLALRAGTSKQSVIMHVTLLTAVYAFMQLFFAPVWGRLSDRFGRRPLILMGIAGYVIAQILFGLATSLWLLYTARILGGVLSSATLPVSAAYVADLTDDTERARGMAWLGTAVSLGFVVGPALGGVVSRAPWHMTARYGHLMMDSFSIPFFAAAALGVLTLGAAMRWLPESLAVKTRVVGVVHPPADVGMFANGLLSLLCLAAIAPLGLALFEATFALYARETLNYGLGAISAVFVVCGIVMTIFQIGAVSMLSGRVREMYQISLGFAFMGTGFGFLLLARGTVTVLIMVGLLALGTSLIAPNLASAISKRSGTHRVGAVLGVQNAASSLGQASGPLLGGALFVWNINAPYVVAGALLLIVAIVLAWTSITARDT